MEEHTLDNTRKPSEHESDELEITGTSEDEESANEPSAAADGYEKIESDGDPALEVARLNDQLLRTLAEFENYKKRTQRDIVQIIQNASEKLIVEILPVLDDLERALKVMKDTPAEDVSLEHFAQGVEIIYNKLVKTLANKGLKPMESIGKPMDPHLHDALMQVDAPDNAPHTVVDEHEKGYFLNDKVIRHAKVIVSK